MDIKLPDIDIKNIVQAHITAAVAQALSSDPNKLVEQFVIAALSEKKDSYSRETKFEQSVALMVQGAARQAIQEWLNENKEIFTAALRKKLKVLAADGWADSLADKVLKGLQDNFTVYASIKTDSD
jgi:hypothetical protein